MAIYSRVAGSGCPFCSGNRVRKGENDLLSLYPLIAAEWHPTKNGDLTPDKVAVKSNKKVWWLGKCGHEWKAVIGDRTNGGNGCPFCANNKLLVGFNDLKTKNPELVKEWHPIKNGKLRPEDFFPNSHVKVWWICPNGHEYEAYIIHRNNGTGCPICKGKLIVKGINDLETINPTLAKYWNIKKNIIKPFEIGIGSGKKYWWKCPNCGNQWYARVVDVAKKKYICSKCKK